MLVLAALHVTEEVLPVFCKDFIGLVLAELLSETAGTRINQGSVLVISERVDLHILFGGSTGRTVGVAHLSAHRLPFVGD
jgi:hypothetical protein